ncbi:MAG: hypothetical protein ING33_00800, partial [Rhodocyclaceae bacterium]|nr:hypothetical protein [Rhodocyclaceae bacterium]
MNRRLINPIARCCLAALAVAVASTSILALAQAPSQGQSQAIAPGYLVVLGRSFDRNKIIAYSAALP